MLLLRFGWLFTLSTSIRVRAAFAFNSKLMKVYELFDLFRSSFIYFFLLFDLDLDRDVLLFSNELLRALFVGVAAK